MDDEPLTVARAPNVKVWSKDYWDKQKSFLWVRGSDAAHWIEGSAPRPGSVPFPDSAKQNLEGCTMVINSGAWLSFARPIIKHKGRRVEFAPLPKKLPKAYGTRGTNLVGLFFECGTLLDAPMEWWFGKDLQGGNSITVQLPEGENPHGKIFRGRVSDTLLNLDLSQNVKVDNLDFFSGSIRMSRSQQVTVQGCTFLYPHHSKRVLKSKNAPPLIDAGSTKNLRFQNNVVRYSDGALMSMRSSSGAHIQNNEFYMIDLAVIGGLGGTTLDALNNKDFVYRFNTLAYAGSSDNIRYSVVGLTDNVGAQTYMNYHTHCGASQTDGATVQIAAGTGPWNNFVHHNWFINTGRGGMRFDGWQAGVCGMVWRNVAYNTGAWGFRLKGDFHKVIANTDLSTSLHNTGPATDLGPPQAGGKSNTHSFVRNNAAYYDTYGGKWIGNTSHNVAGENMKDLLVDPDGFDFRPKPGKNPLVDSGEVVKGIKMCGSNGSWGHYYEGAKMLPVDASYIGKAPDAGAYERGADSYWLPGRRKDIPSHPIPQGLGSVHTDLIWRPACGIFPECLTDELAGIKTYRVFAGCGDPASPKKAIEYKQIAATTKNLLVRPFIWPFNKPCSWRVDTEMKNGKVRTGEVWDYRATWQNCSIEWIQCNATIVRKNNGNPNTLFSTGKSPWGGKVPPSHTLRGHETYFMQCVVPKSYSAKQGPLGGKWLEAKVNVPSGSRLFPVPGAPLWKAATTTGKTKWVLEAEKNMTIAGAKGPEGYPIGKKRSICKAGARSTSLSGFNVSNSCVAGTATVATKSVYCEDWQTYHRKMVLGVKGLPGGIFRERKSCEDNLVDGPGTYTFALKSKKSVIPYSGPGKPALGVMVCKA